MKEFVFDTLKTTNEVVQDTVGKLSEVQFTISNIWEVDCNGNGSSIMLSIMGMTIVFLSLVLIYFTFNTLSKYLLHKAAQRRKAANPDAHDEHDSVMSGEVSAAIAMALQLYYDEIHDYENTVLTIQKVSRTYSPWSSKIYSLREYPRR